MHQRGMGDEEQDLSRSGPPAPLGYPMSLGPPELIIVFGIVFLPFGAKKLPGLANSMGRSIKEFRKAADGSVDDESAGTA